MFTKPNQVKRAKMMMYLIQSPIKRTKWLKKHNVFHDIGDNCYYHTRDIPTEPYMLSMGNNVRVAANVRFITHDIICMVFNNVPEYIGKYGKSKYYVGKIEIFDNVMIGAESTILYDVKIGPNAIVAAGSVVTKDVKEGTIVAGNPAKEIGKVENIIKRRNALNALRPGKNDGLEKILNYFWD